MFNFTEDQSMALEFPGNVIVSAGAGSGKTRVLVEKYFRLLVDEHPEWPVDSVVAITFTRKAAAELKARIVRRVLDELKLDNGGNVRRKRLMEIRREVGAAPIGTIHTFCGRILREFAFDAQIDPDYVVLEGAEEGALRLQAARETIAEITAMNSGQLYTDLLILLNMLSASRVTELLAGMLAGRPSYLSPAKRYASSSIDELFENLKVFHWDVVGAVREDFAKRWHAAFSDLANRALPGKVYDAASQAIADWPADPINMWSKCEVIIENAMGSLLTAKATCRVREFKQAGIEEFDGIRETIQKLGTSYKKAILSDLSEVDRLDLERSQRLVRLFLQAVDQYEKLRGGGRDQAEAQMLDFSDLELMAHKLVTRSSEIRRKLRSNYPFLIVDEFQDTSQSQWDILRPLVTGEDGNLRQAALFIVGDRKQGVYGFRDANVQLFSQVQALVTQSNYEWNGSEGLVSMSANFRTTEVPLTFINKVFDRILSEAGNAYGVEFEALTPMKFETPGCVEFLIAGGDESESGEADESAKLSADDQRENEARLVAAHISSLLESGEAKPRDIALLFRKRSGFNDFEVALRERGIPCVVQQGLNLFQQPELADLTAALNAVVYPHRDLVFVHYLRSPFIGFTDDLLLKIARTRGRSYWDKANRVLIEGRYQLDDRYHLITVRESERLAFALGVLEKIRALVGRVPPYNVVKAMVDELGVLVTVMAGYRGTQAVANIEKLLDVARSAESLSFEDFLNYIKSEEQSLKGTAEAADLTTADAVKIMTIHAAKGLEFPVVYLPSLNAGTSGRMGDVNSDGAEWLTLRLSKSLVDKPPFLANYFSMVAQKQSNAEERRIFYVAMTRCEKRLILCANVDAKPRGETFFQWIADEFESAKGTPLFKTNADFKAMETFVGSTEQFHSAGFSSRPRGERIEAALRAAIQMQHLERKNEITTIPRPGIMDDLVPRFLGWCLSDSPEAAWKNIEAEVTLRAPAGEMDFWKSTFACTGIWLRDKIRSGVEIQIAPVLRVPVSRGVLTIRPHVRINGVIGWLALGVASNERAKHEATLYTQGAAEYSNLPKAEVWQMNPDLDEISPA